MIFRVRGLWCGGLIFFRWVVRVRRGLFVLGVRGRVLRFVLIMFGRRIGWIGGVGLTLSL